jgi:hypothetical protein
LFIAPHRQSPVIPAAAGAGKRGDLFPFRGKPWEERFTGFINPFLYY